MKPEYETVNINTDASWIASTKNGDRGVMAQECDGRIIVERNTTCEDVSIKNLEAKAIHQALQLVILHNWDVVTMKSDAQ